MKAYLSRYPKFIPIILLLLIVTFLGIPTQGPSHSQDVPTPDPSGTPALTFRSNRPPEEQPPPGAKDVRMPLPTSQGTIDQSTWGVIYEENFEAESTFENWMVDGIEQYLVTEASGSALKIGHENRNLPLRFGYIHNTSVQARIMLQHGSIVIGVHNSSLGNYRVEFTTVGAVSLYRYQTLLETTDVTVQLANTWRNVEIRVEGSRIMILLDQTLILDSTDVNPLPFGTSFFSTVGQHDIALIDDIRVSGLIQPPPASQITISAEPGVDRAANGRNLLSTESIAYTTYYGDIYVIDPDGSNVTQITDSGSAHDWSPVWSWDRTRIAFVSDRSGAYNIWIAYPNTSHPLEMLNATATSGATTLSWSPVDDRIAYSNGSHIYIFDETSSPQNELITTGHHPDWSPDGTRLVFVDRRLVYNEYQLAIIHITSGSRYSLQSEGNSVNSPDWSPHTNVIAYTWHGDYPSTGISTISASVGSLSTNVTFSGSSFGGSPTWSPDGSQIAFIGEGNGIYIVDAAGGAATNIMASPITVGGTEWGRKITFGCGTLMSRALHCSPTPESCMGNTIATIDNSVINLRLTPWGEIIRLIVPQIEVQLLGGWNDDGQWWWYIRHGVLQGYVHGSLVEDPNSCPRPEIAPPSPPAPTFNAECWVKLPDGASSEPIYNYLGNSIPNEAITTNSPLQVYGVWLDANGFLTYYLILNPGDPLPQKWIRADRFGVAEPAYARSCLPSVLGRFPRTNDAEYWSIIGTYAHDFEAPVSFQSYQYSDFRNSQPFTAGHHEGMDLAYKPPDGTGNTQSFTVIAQHDGVVVEAGPSGIVSRHVMAASSPTSIFPYQERPGTDYSNGYLTYAVTWASAWDFRQIREERPNSGHGYSEPPFGLSHSEVQRLLSTGWQHVTCDKANNIPLTSAPPDCSQGADRQIIIQYDAVTTDGDLPDIQTVYFHTDITSNVNYSAWRTVCSMSRVETWAKRNLSEYQVCRVVQGQWLGVAKQIGWSTAAHLHYEVFIDEFNNGSFAYANGKKHRGDPLMAFRTFR